MTAPFRLSHRRIYDGFARGQCLGVRRTDDGVALHQANNLKNKMNHMLETFMSLMMVPLYPCRVAEAEYKQLNHCEMVLPHTLCDVLPSLHVSRLIYISLNFDSTVILIRIIRTSQSLLYGERTLPSVYYTAIYTPAE